MKLKISGAVVLTLMICIMAAFSSMAYEDVEFVPTGPATGLSAEDFHPDGSKPEGAGGLVNAVPMEDGTFLFEGKKYIIEYKWEPQHCLTGYAATGNCTASGKMPTLYHTISGPKAMLGKVALVIGNYKRGGTANNNNLHAYDGIYVFEDTGGPAVEHGIESTMNSPVVDIYRGSLADAVNVTANGSIVADVYILREINN